MKPFIVSYIRKSPIGLTFSRGYTTANQPDKYHFKGSDFLAKLGNGNQFSIFKNRNHRGKIRLMTKLDTVVQTFGC